LFFAEGRRVAQIRELAIEDESLMSWGDPLEKHGMNRSCMSRPHAVLCLRNKPSGT